MYIIFRWKSGVRFARFARELGVARSTVSAFFQDLCKCPSLLLTLPLIRVTREEGGPGRAHSSFLCLLCAFQGRGGEASARAHLGRDLIPEARGNIFSIEEAWRYLDARYMARREAELDRQARSRQKARHAVEAGDYERACFASHQAAEKAVKAVFQK